MTGICGWLGSIEPVEQARSEAWLKTMAERLGAPDLKWSSHAAEAGGAAVRSRSADAAVARHGALVVAIDGRPRWTDEAMAALAAGRGHTFALAQAYEREGAELLHGLGGDFSLSVIDLERRRALLAIDRIGRGRMYYACPASACLVFGSTADSVAAHPNVSSTLSEQGIYEYLFFYYSPAPQTIYREQKKLMAGQYLVFDDSGVRTDFYWRMPYSESADAPAGELAGELRRQVSAAVGRAVANENLDRVGAFLSGGLDSSTMTGHLNEQRPAPASCFTIGFDEPGYDEMAFAANAARHFGARHVPYYMTNEDLLDSIPRIAAAYDEPFGNSSAVPTYICARLARQHGIDVMIAGDGGDELFAGNERYVAYDIYERYNRLPCVLRKGLVAPAVRALSAVLDHAILRKGRNFLRYADTPIPDRVVMFNAFGRASIESAYGTLDAVFEPDFVAAISTERPIEGLREIHQRTSSSGLVHRMMHVDLQRTLADNDLRKVGLMCELAGVEVRYPFLDDEVVTFSAGLPTRLLLKGGRLRGFYKEAYAGFLPRETIEKSKHGFGLPTVEWMRATKATRDMVRDAVDGFSRRRIIRKSFCDEIVRNLMEDGSTYLANSTWDILLLELWMQQRGFRA